MICFDLDGTLCTNTGGDYDAALPFAWAIARVNRLARAGHHILIYTARGTATGIDWGPVTRGQLERWGVEYNELRFGKPSAAVFVDDRAVHTEAWRRDSAFALPALVEEGADSGRELLPTVLAASLTTVVEIGRTFAGRAVRLEAHAARLLDSARRAGVGARPELSDVVEAVERGLEAETDEELVYAISLSEAPHIAHLEALASGGAPRLAVACRPLSETLAGLRAMRAVAASPAVAAQIEPGASRGLSPDRWPLRRDGSGAISAGLGARLGIVVGQTIVLSPPAAAEEVAAGWLRELALEAGLTVESRALTEDDLGRAEEAFVVGEPFCLLALAAIGERVLPTTMVTARLRKAWSATAGLDLNDELADGAEMVVSEAAGP